ncbi:MAG TPA: serine/threonine-protein kinase [Polyangia bacterium]|nr:serine/threonine-protein kinase [Polyangia bacterium]
MSSKVRRVAGTLLIVAACGAGATGFVVGASPGDAARSPQARLSAELARRSVETAWKAQRRALESRATAAAAIQPLHAALTTRVDGHTLIDLFETEEWWRPVREEWKAARLIVGEQLMASQGKLDLGTADRELVAAARKDQVASGVAVVKGVPVLLVAVRVPVMDQLAPVLVLGNELEIATVQALADRTGQAVMLSEIGGSIAIAGTNDQRLAIQGLVGREASGFAVDPNGHWVAAVVVLGGGVRVWTLHAVTIEGLASQNRSLIPWAIAPILLAIGLVLTLSRRNSNAPTAEVLKDTTLRFGTPSQTHKKLDGNPLNVSSPSPAAASAAGELVASSRGQVKLFGRYKLLDHLGQGGMADIYTAVASGVEGFTRVFVLKRLRCELAKDKEAISQFIDEARMQAGLVHSNIVPVFDFGVVNGEYFMTQEYIVGRDLVRIVQRYYEFTKRSMEPRYAYYMAHETLLALEYAHSKRDREGNPIGIVHRDVSAGNIMVSLEGEVKLFDFGIVKARGRSTQTQVGMVKGNTSFMSPEQARGQDVDARSDLFSLALVMFYCLTGRLLYEGDNDLDVLYKAATGPTPKDWEAIYQLPRPAPEIFARALAIDPALRFQSAAEFAHELAPLINGVKAEAASLMQLLFGDELRREAA